MPVTKTLCGLGFGLAVGAVHAMLVAQAPRLEYRVVFASARQLAPQLDAAARDGYSCATVARPESGVVIPGIVVVLGRPTDGSRSAAAQRVIAGGSTGTNLQAPLDAAGADGFRLCGVALDESTPVPALVAVMSQDAGAQPQAARYGVEVLTNYKASLVRLNAAARNGFVPVAAAPVNNNRLPEMRSWMVVAERGDAATAPRDITVRSGSGADTVERALNEEGKQGYRVDLVWKEGNDVVAMMSRPAGDAATMYSYSAESRSPDSLHALTGLYLGDFPYLTSGARIVISDRSQPASTDVEEDPLPKLGPLGYADPGALEILGNHLSRHRGFTPAHVRIRRGPGGSYVMTTVLSQRAK